MKLECSVEELKLLFKNFDLKQETIEIKLDNKKIGEQFQPLLTKK